MPITNKSKISQSFENQINSLLIKDSKRLLDIFKKIHNDTFISLDLVDSGWLRNQSFVDYDSSKRIFGFRTPLEFKDFRGRTSANYAVAAYYGLNWDRSSVDFSSHAKYGQRKFNEFAALSSKGFLENNTINLVYMRGAPQKRFTSPIYNYT
jgi:hypothetical protein